METKYQHKLKRKLVFLAVYLILLSIGAAFLANQSKKRTIEEGILEIHFLALGKADCILLRTKEESMIIDAGWEETKEKVVDYLKEEGIKNLTYAVATHEDEDHIGGMETILRKFKVNELLISPKQGENEAYTAMIQRAKKRETKITIPSVLSTFSFGDAQITILGPGKAALADGQINNSSLILYITFGERSFLFMGDALKESETELLEQDYRIRADLLKVGHHGFADATSEAFLKAVSPKLAVITCNDMKEEIKEESQKETTKGEENKEIAKENEEITEEEIKKQEIKEKEPKPKERIEPLLEKNQILAYHTGDSQSFVLICDGTKIEVKN